LPLPGFLPGLLFHPEDGGSTLLPKKLLTHYMALHPRRQRSSVPL
jgi:hypothetical protein